MEILIGLCVFKKRNRQNKMYLQLAMQIMFIAMYQCMKTRKKKSSQKKKKKEDISRAAFFFQFVFWGWGWWVCTGLEGTFWGFYSSHVIMGSI